MSDSLKVEVSVDAFSKKDKDEKLDLIYGAVVNQQNVCETQCAKDNKRFSVLENRKHTDKGFAAMMGFIGGFISGFVNKF